MLAPQQRGRTARRKTTPGISIETFHALRVLFSVGLCQVYDAAEVGTLVLHTFDPSSGGQEDADYWSKTDCGGSRLNHTYVSDPSVHGHGSMQLAYHVIQDKPECGFAVLSHIATKSYVAPMGGNISFWYNIQNRSSLASRAALKFKIFEGSDCSVSCNMRQAKYFENWVATYFILDDKPGWTQVTLPLVGGLGT